MPAPTNASLIDVVDDFNQPIATAPRGEVLRRHLNFRTTHVFVFSTEGQLLLQQLARGRDRYPLAWGSSVAAYLHAGESYFAAATRRLREELGLETELQPVGQFHLLDNGSKKFVFLYITQSNHPKIRLPEHIETIDFFDPNAIRIKMAATPDRFTPTLQAAFRYWDAMGAKKP